MTLWLQVAPFSRFMTPMGKISCYICHGKFQTSMRILRWSKFALNLLSYPFLNCSKLSQIKKDDEELNCFYSDVLNFKVLMKGLLCTVVGEQPYKSRDMVG